MAALNCAERPHTSTGRRSIALGSTLLSVAVAMLLTGIPALAVAQSITLPGEFAFRTKKGYHLTAIDGGGRSAAPTIITAATSAGPWEEFRIVVGNPAPAYDKSFQTATGNYITAVNGGGMTSDALHTDATQIRAWEQFRRRWRRPAHWCDHYGVRRTARVEVQVDPADRRLLRAADFQRAIFVTALGGGGEVQEYVHCDPGSSGACIDGRAIASIRCRPSAVFSWPLSDFARDVVHDAAQRDFGRREIRICDVRPWLAANIALRGCSENGPADELCCLSREQSMGRALLVVVMLGLMAACTPSSLAVRGLADQGNE